MGFLKKLFSGFSTKPEKRYYVFQVKCKRCGEIIEGRVDVDNDLSVEYEDGGDVYYVRKVLIGDGGNHCYQQVEVGLKFNKERKLIDRRVESGGEFA
jgi:lysyl-tRNA synthetase class I